MWLRASLIRGTSFLVSPAGDPEVCFAGGISDTRFGRELWIYIRGAPINDDLFDRIGKELGIGGRETVRKLYKAVKEEFEAHRKS